MNVRHNIILYKIANKELYGRGKVFINLQSPLNALEFGLFADDVVETGAPTECRSPTRQVFFLHIALIRNLESQPSGNARLPLNIHRQSSQSKMSERKRLPWPYHDPDHHQSLITCSLYHHAPFHRTAFQSVRNNFK